VTPSAIRDGLKANIQAGVTGVRCYDVIPDSVNVPAAIVGQLDITYHTAMKTLVNSATIEVLAVVSRMDARSAQNSLDTYIAPEGANSFKAAIEANPTLGGAAFDLICTRAQPGTITISGIDYLLYRLEIEVTA
jgi:hypothetical protein